MPAAGFYWCGPDSSPDMFRYFVCLKELVRWNASHHSHENNDLRHNY